MTVEITEVQNLLRGHLGGNNKARIWALACLTLTPEFFLFYYAPLSLLPPTLSHRSVLLARLALTAIPFRRLPHLQNHHIIIGTISTWGSHSTCPLCLGVARVSDWWDDPNRPVSSFPHLDPFSLDWHPGIFQSCYSTLFLLLIAFLWLWSSKHSPYKSQEVSTDVRCPAQGMRTLMFLDMYNLLSSFFHCSTFQSNVGIRNIPLCNCPLRETTERAWWSTLPPCVALQGLRPLHEGNGHWVLARTAMQGCRAPCKWRLAEHLNLDVKCMILKCSSLLFLKISKYFASHTKHTHVSFGSEGLRFPSSAFDHRHQKHPFGLKMLSSLPRPQWPSRAGFILAPNANSFCLGSICPNLEGCIALRSQGMSEVTT